MTHRLALRRKVFATRCKLQPISFNSSFMTILLYIGVGYGEFNGAALPGAVAEGGPAYGKYEAYSTLRAQLAASETSPTDVTAVNSLPSGNSINGISTISVTS